MKSFLEKSNRFSIRKITLGAASVIVGSVMLLGVGNNAHASEQDSTESQQEVTHNNTESTPTSEESEEASTSNSSQNAPSNEIEAQQNNQATNEDMIDAQNNKVEQDNFDNDDKTQDKQGTHNDLDNQQANTSSENEDKSVNDDKNETNKSSNQSDEQQDVRTSSETSINDIDNKHNSVDQHDKDNTEKDNVNKNEVNQDNRHQDSQDTQQDSQSEKNHNYSSDDNDNNEENNTDEVNDKTKSNKLDNQDNKKETQASDDKEIDKAFNDRFRSSDSSKDEKEKTQDETNSANLRETNKVESEKDGKEEDNNTTNNKDFLSSNKDNLKDDKEAVNKYIEDQDLDNDTAKYIKDNWKDLSNKELYQLLIQDFGNKQDKEKKLATNREASKRKQTAFDENSNESAFRSAKNTTKNYKVKNGDTLSGIATKFKTTTAKLQKMNKIKNANAIQVGQTLKVPSAKAPKPKKTSKTQKYTIKNGDTLGGIANKFKTTTSNLQKLNKIKKANNIQAGQTIKVPKQSTSKPSKPSKPSKSHGKQLVSKSQLQQFGWKNVSKSSVKDLNDALNEYKINTPLKIQHFMAQTAAESQLGLYTLELADGSDYEGRTDLGNTQAGDGRKFKGAGYIQLTGRNNYTAFSKAMGDKNILAKGAQYVANNYPWKASAFLWNNLKNINGAIENGASVTQVSQLVNGGNNGLAQRQQFFAQAQQIFK